AALLLAAVLAAGGGCKGEPASGAAATEPERSATRGGPAAGAEAVDGPLSSAAKEGGRLATEPLGATRPIVLERFGLVLDGPPDSKLKPFRDSLSDKEVIGVGRAGAFVHVAEASDGPRTLAAQLEELGPVDALV